MAFFTIFVSHEWLGTLHPDEFGFQCQCLRMAFSNIISGALRVEFDVLAQSLGFNRELGLREREEMKQGYLWMDWFCVPQRRDTLYELTVKLRGCIPSYVERCQLFCIVTPKVQNNQGGLCSYECRAEVWFRQLSSNRNHWPIVLISSEETAQFLQAHFGSMLWCMKAVLKS